MLNRTVPYAVELDGDLSVCIQGQLNALDDLRRIKGDCRVLSDLQGAVARTMTVEADKRYVELMISKKFQETGEFDEPVTVITHWKKKQGKNSTDIFFTALPSKRYHQYLELVREHKDHLLLFPLQSVLLTTLRKNCDDCPSAVVFQHDRFADVIVGTRHKVWYANRVVAFDTSTEQIESLWETIRTDIHAVGLEYRQSVKRIFVVTWVGSQPLPQWTDAEAPELIPVDEEAVTLASQPMQASLPVMMQVTKTGEAIATSTDKLCYGAKRLVPYLNMLLIFLALACAIGGLWYQHRAADLKQQIATLQQNAFGLKDRATGGYTPVEYQPTLAFLDQLWTARSLPGYGQLLHDIAAGLGSELQLEIFKADYNESKVEIEAFGTARAPFDISYKAYQRLQQQLHRRGYVILSERFDTQISRSDFMIRFAKELK